MFVSGGTDTVTPESFPIPSPTMSGPESKDAPLVAMLDHLGNAADELGDALAAAGFRTAISRAVSESVRMLERE